MVGRCAMAVALAAGVSLLTACTAESEPTKPPADTKGDEAAEPVNTPDLEEPVAVVDEAKSDDAEPSRRNENETSAISTLRTIISAQVQFQVSAKCDVDNDGTGEFGMFQEVSGAIAVRTATDGTSTGGSVLKAVDAVRAAGCEVALIAVLVERHEGGADALREQGIDVVSLFRADEEGQLSVNPAFLNRATA